MRRQNQKTLYKYKINYDFFNGSFQRHVKTTAPR